VQLLALAVRKMWAQLAPDFHSCPVETRIGVIPAVAF
jgi:hypothetical protein